ncbi:MAG: phosphotransferase family protein [Promethearchaeota archaeon]
MNFYEERNPPNISLSKVLNLIQPFFPELKAEEIKFLYHGSYNVYEIKDEFIFRFPDKVFFDKKGYDLIQREQKILMLIQEDISIQIPKPLYMSSDPTHPFIGYKKINGTSLSRCFHKTTLDDHKHITKQLGKFLSELHSQKVFQKVCMAFKTEQDFNSSQYQHNWRNYFEKVKKKVYPLLKSKQKQWVSQIFSNFLENERNFDFISCVVHRDFDVTNILVDPKTFYVCGIIDFEDTGVYDPAADFIFYNEGDLFLDHLLANYSRSKDLYFRERMKFLYCRSGLEYILTGLEYNVPKMVEYGLQMTKKRMKRFPS